MNQQLQHQIDVRINRRGVVQRRDFLRWITAAAAAGSTTGWTRLSAQADQLRQQQMACIVLWMQGGPSQFETFSPLPDHANGGETKSIATSVAGIQVSENLPQVAGVMEDLCLIRSMTGKEGSHPRASFLMHTGYLPTASVKYPELGSNVGHQLGNAQFELPGYVRIGRGRFAHGGGFLGVQYDPFVVTAAGRLPDNSQLATDAQRYRRRLRLLEGMEKQFASQGGRQEVANHATLYKQAAEMVTSKHMQAFDLEGEPASVHAAYGDSEFAKGCLLARRLVETGVTFVEVTAGNWDTHQDNFTQSKDLCGRIDQPYAQLLRDLKQRGMLDRTLVVWMGEFGRTPRINPRAGRDHYPRAFTVALAGAGVPGGQTIGQVDKSGSEVTDQPVTTADLFRTIYARLGIDADHENMSGVGRPVKLVEGGQPVNLSG